MSDDFYQKYLKYKQKYNQLKTQLAGAVIDFYPMCHSLDVKCIDKLNEEFTKNFKSKTQITYPFSLKSKYNLPAQSNLLTTYNLLKLLRDFDILKPEHPDKVEELSCNIHRYLKTLLSNFLPIAEGLLNNPGATDLNLNLICTDLFKKENSIFLTNELIGLFEILNKSEFNSYDYPYQLVIYTWLTGSIDNLNKICSFFDENNLPQLQCIITKLIVDKPENYEKIILHTLQPKIFLWYLENKSIEFNSHMLEVLQKNFDGSETVNTNKISYKYIDIIRHNLTQQIIGGRPLVPTSKILSPLNYCSYVDDSSEPFVSELFNKVTMDFVQLLYSGQFNKIFSSINFLNPDKKFILFDGENVLFKMRNSVDVINLSGIIIKPSGYRQEQYKKFFADLFFYNQDYTYLIFFEGATSVWNENITSSYPVGSMETYFIYSTCENGITYNEPSKNPYNNNLFCSEKAKIKSLPCQDIFGKNENDDYMLFLFYWILKLCGNEPKVISADNYRWSSLTIPKHRIELDVVGGNYTNIIVNNNDLSNTDLVNMMKRLGYRNTFKNAGIIDNKDFLLGDKYYYLFKEIRSRMSFMQTDANDFILNGIKSTGAFNQLNNNYFYAENIRGPVKSLIKNFLIYNVPKDKYTGLGDISKLRVQRYFLNLPII